LPRPSNVCRCRETVGDAASLQQAPREHASASRGSLGSNTLMVSAAASTRARTTSVPGGAGVGQNFGQGSQLTRSRRSFGAWVMIGLPALLALVFAWQIGSSLLHTEIVARDAVAVSRVSMESDVAGSRIDLVVVDRGGQDATVSGDLAM